MKAIGIVANLIGVILTIGIFAIYLNDIGSVSIIGGDDGPTTIFLTTKMNYGTFFIASFFSWFLPSTCGFFVLSKQRKKVGSANLSL